MMIARKNLTPSAKVISTRSAVRFFAKETKELTELEKEQAKGLIKVEKFKKYIQQSAGPTTFTDIMGTGKELHIPKNLAEMAVLNGMPPEQQNRTVVISPRPLKTMQSGFAKSHQWNITWKNQERWSNPLMGWTSSADPLTSLKLTFNSQEEAVAFAEKSGWKYETRAPTSEYVVEPGTFNYAQNFLPKKTMALVKEQGIAKTTVFNNKNYGKSHWFQMQTFHGDAEVEQHGPKKEAEKV
jgi:NADH dehydrogenase (ubiquinone) Fe-S protein 4